MGIYRNTQALLRIGFWMYFRKVHILGQEHIPPHGPVLLVSNHPNSFMDALIIGANIQRPTHFLARGDAFSNPILARIFKTYRMLPVYRASEGSENIEKNFQSFDASHEALDNNGMMLLFGEGLCKNNWDLRPMKKGAARIAARAWNSSTVARDMCIIPVGLTYEHYQGGGKSAIVHFGKPIFRHMMNDYMGTPQFVQELNLRISSAISTLAYINPNQKPNSETHQRMMYAWKQAENQHQPVLSALYHNEHSTLSKPPWITSIHKGIIALPHYYVMYALAYRLTKGTVFFDSIHFALTLFLFPIYVLFLACVLLLCNVCI